MNFRNLLALLFVVATQASCAAFYAMERPTAFGPFDQFFTERTHD